MNYQKMIINAMDEKKLSLNQTANLISEISGVKIDRSYLSKLRSGSRPPASDKVNDALAEVLGIDPVDLQVAAYLEKIPAGVLDKLREDPKSNTA